VRWAALAIASVGVVALLWIGGELHYQSCVEQAKARTELTSDDLATFERQPPDEALTKFSIAVESKEHAIQGCSRLPF
jgi:hypothetical protein